MITSIALLFVTTIYGAIFIRHQREINDLRYEIKYLKINLNTRFGENL